MSGIVRGTYMVGHLVAWLAQPAENHESLTNPQGKRQSIESNLRTTC